MAEMCEKIHEPERYWKWEEWTLFKILEKNRKLEKTIENKTEKHQTERNTKTHKKQ